MSSSPVPAQAPSKPRGPCLTAQSEMGLRDWAERKDWVGLPTAREAVTLTGAWYLAPPPYAGSKRTTATGAGSELGRRIPTLLFGDRRRAAPRRGRAGTCDSAGRLGQDQADSRGLLGTTEGTGGLSQLCASSGGPEPLPPPPPSCGKAGCGGADWRLRRSLLPGLGQCMGPGREKLSHVWMVAGLCGRHHPH